MRWNAPAQLGVDACILGREVTAIRDASTTPTTITVESVTNVPLAKLEQVHGNRVAVVEKPGSTPATDAAVTKMHGLTLTVRTADCVPVLLASPGGVGIAHAGWRGSAAGIAGLTAKELLRVTGDAKESVAAFIGPSIGPCCYEVGPEVAGAFEPRFLRAGTYLDLWAVNRAQLEAQGVPTAAIVESRICTRCHQHLFHSHRGSGGKKGRIDARIRRDA